MKKLTQSQFKELYENSFEPDPRMEALVDRLRRYYQDTPPGIGNKEVRLQQKLFYSWCKQHGFSRKEISEAKSICRGVV